MVETVRLFRHNYRWGRASFMGFDSDPDTCDAKFQ